MDWKWLFFSLGLLVWPIIRVLAVALNQAVIDRRTKKFLKLVNVTFPDQEQITFISLDTSDKRAMAKLERQIRDQFKNIQTNDEDRSGDRGVDRSLRRETARHRQGPQR